MWYVGVFGIRRMQHEHGRHDATTTTVGVNPNPYRPIPIYIYIICKRRLYYY